MQWFRGLRKHKMKAVVAVTAGLAVSGTHVAEKGLDAYENYAATKGKLERCEKIASDSEIMIAISEGQGSVDGNAGQYTFRLQRILRGIIAACKK